MTRFEWDDLTFAFELSADGKHVGICIESFDGTTEVSHHINPDLDQARELVGCIEDVLSEAAAGGSA